MLPCFATSPLPSRGNQGSTVSQRTRTFVAVRNRNSENACSNNVEQLSETLILILNRGSIAINRLLSSDEGVELFSMEDAGTTNNLFMWEISADHLVVRRISIGNQTPLEYV